MKHPPTPHFPTRFHLPCIIQQIAGCDGNKMHLLTGSVSRCPENVQEQNEQKSLLVLKLLAVMRTAHSVLQKRLAACVLRLACPQRRKLI